MLGGASDRAVVQRVLPVSPWRGEEATGLGQTHGGCLLLGNGSAVLVSRLHTGPVPKSAQRVFELTTAEKQGWGGMCSQTNFRLLDETFTGYY